MPTFNDPTAGAAELREAARYLAHAARTIEDPTAIYSAIESIGATLTSMAQVLHQVGSSHDQMTLSEGAVPLGRTGRACAYQVSWELHLAAEMITQVVATVERAHQIQAEITYDVHVPRTPSPASSRAAAGCASRHSL